MKEEPRGRIQERIEAAAAESGGGVLAFDGDGTLWSGDVGEDFFEALLEEGVFSRAADERFRAEASGFGLPSRGTSVEVLRGLFRGYQEGEVPEERMCEIMAWAPAGIEEPRLASFCDAVIEKVGLGARLHPEAVSVLGWALSRGLEVFLVSASPRPIVLAAARSLGFPEDRVVAATAASDPAGTGLPEVLRPIPYGPGKVARLRERARIERGTRPLLAAFGDNVFDLAMLAEACVPVAVRPKARLRDRAGELPALVAIVREDRGVVDT